VHPKYLAANVYWECYSEASPGWVAGDMEKSEAKAQRKLEEGGVTENAKTISRRTFPQVVNTDLGETFSVFSLR